MISNTANTKWCDDIKDFKVRVSVGPCWEPEIVKFKTKIMKSSHRSGSFVKFPASSLCFTLAFSLSFAMSRARTVSRADVEVVVNTSSTTLSPAVLLSAATAATKDPADAQEELLSVLLESQQLAPAIKAIFDRSWQGKRVYPSDLIRTLLQCLTNAGVYRLVLSQAGHTCRSQGRGGQKHLSHAL
jgi:hypothetical protein